MALTRILQPGELEEARGGIVECLLPGPDLFARRAQRCRQLAGQGSALAAYLQFIARLSALQQEELGRPGDAAAIAAESAWLHKQPEQLPAGLWAMLRRLALALADSLPGEERRLFHAVSEQEEPWFSTHIRAVLAGQAPAEELAMAPLSAAVLQVQWTRYLLARAQTPPPRHEESAVCPLCGGQPVAAVIAATGEAKGLRYLHCGLCGAAWHMVRSKCSFCGESREIGYFSLEGEMEHVRAEACSDCHSYLKVMYQQEQPDLEPLADDLASLALDIRMGEEGFLRSGMNPLFIAGTPSTP